MVDRRIFCEMLHPTHTSPLWWRLSKNLLLLSTILCCALSVPSAAALTMSDIELAGSVPYARLGKRTELYCHYNLSDDHAVEKLGWFKSGVPVMTWTPPDPPLPSLEYRDKLDVSQQNGSLVFLKTSAEEAGIFTCTVQATGGTQQTTEPFALVVADVPESGFSMHGNVADCVLHFSFSSPPVYPKPTPLCGVWSEDTQYTGTAADWQAVPYYNGSVAYSILDTTFPVRSMPLKSGIRCELSFPPPTVNKDDTAAGGAAAAGPVVAWQNTAFYPQVSERGCPPLEVDDGIVVHYTNHRTTCRGELTPQDFTAQLVASVKCGVGRQSSLRGGGMAGLQLTCDGAQWHPVGGVQWHEFEDMKCSDNTDVHYASSSNKDDMMMTEEDMTSNKNESLNTAAAFTPCFATLFAPALIILGWLHY